MVLSVFAGMAGSSEDGAPESMNVLAGLSYAETLTGGARKEDRVPMVIALHYMSGSPETSIADYGGIDAPARLLSLAGPHRFDEGYSWFADGYYELDAAEQRTITFEVADRVAAFIREAANRYPTQGKPLITGYSQGADLTHVIALRDPGLISAGLPMGGRFPQSWRETIDAEREPPARIVLFHGATDAVVDVSEAVAAASYYTDRGVSVTLHTYADVGHGYPAEMKSDYEAFVGQAIRESR